MSEAVEWLSSLEARAKASIDSFTVGDENDRLLHELRVHRIELEMQNDELLASQNSLEQTVERSRALLAAARLGHLCLDKVGCIHDLDLVASDLLGRHRHDLIGRHLQGFLSPADADTLHLRIQDCARFGTAQALDVQLATKDEAIDVRVRIMPDVHTSREFRCFVLLTDISAQLAREKRLAGEKLELATRLVRGISARYDALLEELRLGVKGMQRSMSDAGLPIDVATEATLREAVSLSSDLHALCPGPEDSELLYATKVVQETVGSICELLRGRISLVVDPNALGCVARAGREDLSSIIFRLGLRSLDPLLATGQATLRVSRSELRAPMFDRTAPSGSYLKLSMSTSLDAVAMEKYREAPAARSHPDFLALAKVIESCEGLIDLSDESASEVQIDIYLPLMESVAASEVAAIPKQRIVLLVDDNDMVRGALARVLRYDGFDVIDVGSGAEALQLAEDGGQQIDILLTDVCMPKMNGAQLGASMSQLRPGLPRIYMSGNTNGITLEDEATFVGKPCKGVELVKLLHSKLQED
jgi:CheY-like chemotaxis protein/PAS domain-containing protein